MEDEKSGPPLTVPPAPLFPFPVALYEWNGIIFEVYRGGQPHQPVRIRWERLKTVNVTRNQRDCNVDINQGHQKPRP